MAICPVSPMMHAMINGTCCDHQTAPMVSIPKQVQATQVESISEAFSHAFMGA